MANIIDPEKNKQRFCDLFDELVTRDGSKNLLNWLLSKSDFFTAPASTRYHLNVPGGLCAHSIHVYHRLRELWVNEYGPEAMTKQMEESIAIVGLLHDLCKVNFYKPVKRNRKNEDTGKWEQYEAYTIEDNLPYGHGEKSVYMITGFMKLTREEAFAIRYHMGAWQDGEKNNVSRAYNLFPLAVLAHHADELATFIDEVEASE